LHDARKIVLAGHLAKRRVGLVLRCCAAATTGIWWIKLYTIEQVKELGPELEAYSTIGTKLRILKRGKVKVLLSVVTDVRLGTRIVAVTIVVGVARVF